MRTKKTGLNGVKIKVRIDVVEEPSGYRALISIGFNPKPLSRKIVFTSIGEANKFSSAEIKQAIDDLKRKVKEWAIREGIKFIHNVDPDTIF